MQRCVVSVAAQLHHAEDGCVAEQALAPAAAQGIVDAFEAILNGHTLTFLDSPKAKLIVQLVQDTITQGRKVLIFVCTPL